MDRDDEQKRKLFAVAQLYYEGNLTQKQISQRMEIPQPTVSRLLEDARSADWLKVRVIADYPFELEKIIKDRYHLADCRVALTHASMSVEDKAAQLGRECADYLREILRGAGGDERLRASPEPLRVGIAGGTTLSTMLHHMPLKGAPSFKETHLYPAMGMFATDDTIEFINGVVIVSDLHDRVANSKGYWLPLPPLHPRGEDAQHLSKEELLAQRSDWWNRIIESKLVSDLYKTVNEKLDVVFTGMGAPQYNREGRVVPDADTGRHFVKFLKEVDPLGWETFLMTPRAGAPRIIGDLSFLPFSEEGNEKYELLEKARLGIEWNAMRRMVADGKRVVLACGGPNKHETLYKLLSLEKLKRTVNVLITDIEAAEYLKERRPAGDHE